MPEKQQTPNAEFISYRKEVPAQLNKTPVQHQGRRAESG